MQKISCLDLAENMIAMAQEKLAAYPRVSYVLGDFNAIEGDEAYDVVVSSLALHHLVTDADKQQFYRRINCSLRPGGVFYNADVVLGTSCFLQQAYMQQWRAFMCRNVSRKKSSASGFPITKLKIVQQS